MDDDTGHIHPKAAKTRSFYFDKTTDQSKQDCNSGCSRDKVLNREAKRLAQVTQCGLAGIGLPVGIGHKTGSGIKGQIPFHTGKALGIAGKDSLQDLEQEQEHQPDPGKDQHTDRILLPIHLLIPVHPHHLVNQVFAGGEHPGQECFLSVHHLFDVST